MRRKRPPTWRYATGSKGVNRVTVFERRDRPNVLYVEWWDDDGRNKRQLKTVTGAAVPNTEEGRELAVRIAETVATAQERKRLDFLAGELGLPRPRSVTELLERFHADHKDQWSDAHARDQERYRSFWTRKLGHLTLTQVRPALVARVAAAEAKKRSWRPSTHGHALVYLKSAYNYAVRMLKWIEARHDLAAVKPPTSARGGPSFTEDELKRLLPALEAEDLRAGLIGHVCWQTGRRYSQVRKLPRSAIRQQDGHVIIDFPPGPRNKSGRGLSAPVDGHAAELVKLFAARRRRYLLGSEPPTADECQTWMRRAIKTSEIEKRRRLGWHSIKRRFSAATDGMPGRHYQADTSEAMLKGTYEPDELEPKLRLAAELARRVEA